MTHDYGIQSCEEFLRVMHSLKREMMRQAEAAGLTLQQASLLHILHESGDQLMGAMAERMHCDASNITGIIERLTIMGYVERKELPTDRRAKQLHITEKGQKFVENIRHAIPQAVGFTDLDERDQKELHRILTMLGGTNGTTDSV